MVRSRRLLEILGLPVAVFASAFAGSWVANYSGVVLPHGMTIDMWLAHHPILDFAEGEVSFLLFALIPAAFVALATYLVLLFLPQRGAWWRIHIHLTCLWYVYAGMAMLAFIQCLGECDGAYIGMSRAAAYAGVGGAWGNVFVVRAITRRQHAA